MANAKTAKELLEFLQTVVAEGKGDLPILFDTEAKTFNYHMAEIDRVYQEDEPYPHVQFHEKRHDPTNESQKFYWHVTYSYSYPSKAGNGEVLIWTSQNWFPIKAIREWILKDIKADKVIISNWKEISKQEYDEAGGENPDINNGQNKG